jgi:hypothetical protein
MRLLPLVLLLALAGCGGGGSGSTDPTTGDPVPPGTPLVKYQRGGGIAATYVELTVPENGRATVLDGYPDLGDQTRRTFTLEGDELEEVRAAVEAASPLEREETETICADCFEYAIAAGGEKVSFDDVDVDEGNVSAEIIELRDLLQAIADDHDPAPAPGG